jgi:hypothetical protein
MHEHYLHVKLHTEEWLLDQPFKVENYRKLKPLKMHRQNGIQRSLHLFLRRLGRSLISFGERLENKKLSSASCGE